MIRFQAAPRPFILLKFIFRCQPVQYRPQRLLSEKVFNLPFTANIDSAIEPCSISVVPVDAKTSSLIYPARDHPGPAGSAPSFPQMQPLEVELGCGDGSFLVEYARTVPGRNFIGVERLLGRIRKLDRKGQRAGLTNLRGFALSPPTWWSTPATSFRCRHPHLLPGSWPKRRHWRHRLINERFPQIAMRALAPGGTVYLRTDDAAYFEQMLAVFRASPDFHQADTPGHLLAIMTDFEREFRARGIPTLHAAFTRL